MRCPTQAVLPIAMAATFGATATLAAEDPAVRKSEEQLAAELANLPEHASILALGQIAHQAVLRAQGLKLKDHPFAHASHYRLPDGRRLVSSYHCSRYNTQTRRLTPEMFAAVFTLIQTKD